jgi:hypothetical protein
MGHLFKRRGVVSPGAGGQTNESEPGLMKKSKVPLRIHMVVKKLRSSSEIQNT